MLWPREIPHEGAKPIAIPSPLVGDSEPVDAGCMDDDAARRRKLCQQIEERQLNLLNYLQMARPRRILFSNTSIISSSLVALLTAGPGIGKENFTSAFAKMAHLGSGAVVWQVICLVAAILSVLTTVATKMATSDGGTERITAAETANAELEGLRAALTYGDLPLSEAAHRYQQSLAKAAFVHNIHSGRTRFGG